MSAENLQSLLSENLSGLENAGAESQVIELQEAITFSMDDIAAETSTCRGSCSQSSNSNGCRSACSGSCGRCSGQ